MSTENAVLRLSFQAAEDLSNYQYHFVVLDPTTGKIRLPDSKNERALGILQDAPTSGQAGSVMLIGKSKLVAASALGPGTFVKPEYVSAADAGKAEAAVGDGWKLARARVLEPAQAEDELCAVELIGPIPYDPQTPIGRSSVSTINTAGDVAYTAAQLLGGLIIRDPNGANRSDQTPSVAQMAAALAEAGYGGSVAGLSFEFVIRNAADAAETITLTAGSGITISGTASVAQNNSRRFLWVMNDESTATIYSLGAGVH